MHNNQHRSSKLLRENLEQGDLKRLVHTEMHIDEYKSKMGDDADVCVISFKISGKEPSADLVNFIEKGYDFVLDADVSSGEKEGGDYLVFVELDRNNQAATNIMQLMDELMNLTTQTTDEWRVRYYKARKEQQLSLEALESLIPTTPEAYEKAHGQSGIDELKTAAGINVTTKAPKNDFTETLRSLAGIIR